jgi:hypothetical protein
MKYYLQRKKGKLKWMKNGLLVLPFVGIRIKKREIIKT